VVKWFSGTGSCLKHPSFPRVHRLHLQSDTPSSLSRCASARLIGPPADDRHHCTCWLCRAIDARDLYSADSSTLQARVCLKETGVCCWSVCIAVCGCSISWDDLYVCIPVISPRR
uniref:Uncharacterized protein n=1 Tax=Amphiprion percula TaxID=161767 RepID=A0A3P8S1R2_AMPPE